MRRCVVVCRHPESNQLSWELLRAMADDATFCSITVFGVQNTTPNKARILPSKVRLLEPSDKHRLDVDQVQQELESSKYDCILVVHSVSVVANVMTALRPHLSANPTTLVGLYCEVAREMCLPAHFVAIGEIAEALKDRVFIASSTIGRSEFTRADVHNVRTLSPCLSLRGVTNVPRAVVEHARSSLQTRDTFSVLSLGRADTSVFMFVNFMARNRGARAKLLMPIDPSTRDAVTHLFRQEMRARCPDIDDPSRNLVLMSDLSHLTIDDMRTFMCACDVVVHANPSTDFNLPAKVAACLPVVQIVPNREVHTAHLDPKHTITVPCGFDMFTFEDYGGKVSLATPADLAVALSEVYAVRAQPPSCAPPSAALLAETDYTHWRRFLSFKRNRPSNNTCGAPCATPTSSESELREMRKQLQHLMSMLMPESL